MSSRARRFAAAHAVEPFTWTVLDGGAGDVAGPAAARRAVSPALTEDEAPAQPPRLTQAEQESHLAALEREAFTKGYAQGERAGLEAGGKRADAMLRRVAQTLDDLTQLRRLIVTNTERQMVQLALAVARRIVSRELTQDPELVAALAHVALQRLGESAPATIRLNPEDHAVVIAQRAIPWAGTQVAIVPDPAVVRGGCLVESDLGTVDASLDAQVAELSRALLGEDAPGRSRAGA
jgi:flagellar assembly protein FliH